MRLTAAGGAVAQDGFDANRAAVADSLKSAGNRNVWRWL
jgi:hypothetical protein